MTKLTSILAENASRICLQDGTWFVPDSFNDSNSGWTNYSSCVAKSPSFKHQHFDLGVAKIVMVCDHHNLF